MPVFLCVLVTFSGAAYSQTADSVSGDNKVEKKADAPSVNKGKEKAKEEAVSPEKGIEGINDRYSDEDFRPKTEEESYVWMIFKTVFVLGLMVGVFYYFFRFVTKKAGIQVLGEDVVNLLSVVPLGQNKYLHVVDIAGKVMVLGVSDNNINLITEVASKEEADRIRLLSSKSAPVQEGGFQEYLSRQIGTLIGKISDIKKGKDVTEKDPPSNIDLRYLKDQKRRLKDLNGHED